MFWTMYLWHSLPISSRIIYIIFVDDFNYLVGVIIGIRVIIGISYHLFMVIIGISYHLFRVIIGIAMQLSLVCS